MKHRAFLLVMAALAVTLFSACSASLVNDPGSAQPTIALHTPAANLTPTPTSPPVTLKGQASNPSPKPTDSITIYAFFHASINGGFPRPVAGVSINVSFHFYSGAPVVQLNNQVSPQQTTPAGMAAFPITFSGLQPQTPVIFDLTAVYQGQTYLTQTAGSFTPLLSGTPTPTPPGP